MLFDSDSESDSCINEQNNNAISIIGFAGKFPQSKNHIELWNNLMNKKNLITDFTFDADLDKTYTKKGGFLLEDVLDNFNLKQDELDIIDPQQLLLLNCVKEAIANIKLSKNTGVFIGASNSTDNPSIHKNILNQYSAISSALSIISNRISYTYKLDGPSLTIDTACSSSLVALDTACTFLHSNKCEYAIVGGVNKITAPDVYYAFCKANMLSPTGQIKSFQSDGDGFVRSEAAGVVILQKTNKYPALAYIKSTGSNNNGSESAYLTTPSRQIQEKLYKQVLNDANLKSSDIDYIECHGTGTALGDMLELKAIKNSFKHKLYLGCIKPNIGHPEPAAGICQLIKSLMILQHKVIPPNLYTKYEDNIIMSDEEVKLEKDVIHIAVMSMGFGGTNACCIISNK